jgi:hypothetical protein
VFVSLALNGSGDQSGSGASHPIPDIRHAIHYCDASAVCTVWPAPSVMRRRCGPVRKCLLLGRAHHSNGQQHEYCDNYKGLHGRASSRVSMRSACRVKLAPRELRVESVLVGFQSRRGTSGSLPFPGAGCLRGPEAFCSECRSSPNRFRRDVPCPALLCPSRLCSDDRASVPLSPESHRDR